MDESQRIRAAKTQTGAAMHIIRRRRLDLGLLTTTDANPRLTAGAVGPADLAQGIRSITAAELSTIFGLQTVPGLPTVSTLSFAAYDFVTRMIFTGNVLSTGTSAVTARGVVWNTTGNPTIADNVETDPSGGLGPYSTIFNVMDPAIIYARAYATNTLGTSYGFELSAEAMLCLAEGTLITLADFSVKPIEMVTYDDTLLVWNFDNSRLSFAKPLWIKRREIAPEYNLLTFSNGTKLRTINQHRIFNKEAGEFTYPMTDATPMGTTTFMWNGTSPSLVSKRIIEESVAHYNIITYGHMNLFANGILTSCRFSNVYPIVNMRYVKPAATVAIDKCLPLPQKYIEGMRLNEQSYTDAEIIAYVSRMEEKTLQY